MLTVQDACLVGPLSTEDFIFGLKKCRKDENLAYARHLHAHVCKDGLEVQKLIGNYIVPMFVECRSLSDAQNAFNRLIFQNEHAWTSLILGYIECGQLQHAINLYNRMQNDSIPPSSYTLVALLKACARLKDVEAGRRIHVDIIEKGFGTNHFVGCTLVSMYSKCSSLVESQNVFDMLPVQNVVAWNILIAGYAENGLCMDALKCFKQMQVEDVFSDVVTLVSILKACGSIGAIIEGRETHTLIVAKVLEKHLDIASSLIVMYIKCGSLAEAENIFDNMHVRDVVLWNAMIAGYVEDGCGRKAIECFEEMQADGKFPQATTYMSILKACASIGVIAKGREIHHRLAKEGFEKDIRVGSSLIVMYSKCGSLTEARYLFDHLQVQDVVSWNALISGYAEHEAAHDVLQCLDQMHLEGISLDNVTYVCSLKACVSPGAISKGRELHTQIVCNGFQRDPFVGNALVNMYAKCGSIVEAQEVFENLLVQDIVSWNALIAGYCENGLSRETINCFERMQLECVSPNAVTFVWVLNACSDLGSMCKAKTVHSIILDNGVGQDIIICNTLIDVYAKCNSLTEARKVFNNLSVQSVVPWTALIEAYAEHGHGQEALNCFNEMQLEGVSPDDIAYICILKACGSIGALEKGQDIHALIDKTELGADPFVANAIVDMYVKCGSVADGRKVFDNSVQEVASWNAMIGGYGMNYQGSMAVQCFEDMQGHGINPDGATFVCLLTACSRANLIYEGQTYFKRMTEEYGIVPTVDHHTCMVDLFARAGQLYVAETFVTWKCPPSKESWMTLLGACKTYGEDEIGLRCFEKLVQIEWNSTCSQGSS